MPHTKLKEFANGKKMFFSHISEYEALHRYDRNAYVLRLMTLYHMAMKGANDREQWVNEARQEAAKLHKDLEGFKSSFWYRLYKFTQRWR